MRLGRLSCQPVSVYLNTSDLATVRGKRIIVSKELGRTYSERHPDHQSPLQNHQPRSNMPTFSQRLSHECCQIPYFVLCLRSKYFLSSCVVMRTVAVAVWSPPISTRPLLEFQAEWPFLAVMVNFSLSHLFSVLLKQYFDTEYCSLPPHRSPPSYVCSLRGSGS